MAYLGNAPARSFISFERQVFTIVNSQTAYTLDHSVNNENDIRLVINNIVQEPGSGKAYTASGTTLTLSAALVNGTDEMYCVFLGRATATNAPGAGSVGASQLASDAVTEAKIADDAVESEHLNDNVISGQTELAVAPDSTDELLISDGGTLKRIDVSLIGGTMTPAFLAYRSGSTQTIASATGTKIQLNSELFDTDNAFDNSTNYRFTPQTAGKYFFYATSRFDTDTDFQNCELQVHKNGSQYSDVTWRNEYYEVATVTGVAVMNGSSDYLELFIYQNSGSSKDIGYDSGNRFLTKMGAYKIIE